MIFNLSIPTIYFLFLLSIKFINDSSISLVVSSNINTILVVSDYQIMNDISRDQSVERFFEISSSHLESVDEDMVLRLALISVARSRVRERFMLDESRRIRRWIDLNASAESRRDGVRSAPAESEWVRKRGRGRGREKYRPLRTIKGPSSAPPPLFRHRFSCAVCCCCCAGCCCWCRLRAFGYTALQNR